MITHPIPYGHQYITEDDIQAVVDTLRSDYLTQGPRIPHFEQQFADYLGVRYAIPNNFGKLSKYGISAYVGYQGIFMDKVELIEEGQIQNALRVLMQNVKFGIGFNF